AQAKILLVSPRADSLSQKLLGRAWPHKLDDHHFHWSKKGLCEFMERWDFGLKEAFLPQKSVSTQMLISHLAHKFNFQRVAIPGIINLNLRFNLGEMGLLFENRGR
ncbi:MAG: hypothetical protein QGI45_17170, partial [Myxococcota bacterium]|nr:hypothetical protein [Myxococcota bacterium]